jgi:linoleoyl-CoA desaturase
MNHQTVSFSKETNVEFYKTLRSRVNNYFKENNITRHANASMVIKTIAMLAIYLVPFGFLFVAGLNSWVYFLCWVGMGIGMAGCGLSIMHDANHGAYSRNETINKAIGNVLILLGGSAVNWKIQHNVLHHTYTNITHLDEDIDPPGKLLRFTPHKKRYAQHKFQHLYAWFFYGMMTMMWFSTKDFKQAKRYKEKDLIKTQGTTYARHMTFIILFKIIYVGLFIVCPFVFSPASWSLTLIGFVVMHFIAGFILSIIFQPAHVVPSSNYPMPDDSGNIEADWAVNQLYNTADFAPKAKLFSWYVGGLNFQVEHHLFPNICHVHYSKLAEIVKSTAEEFNLPYHSYKTFYGALADHTKMLYNLGHYDHAPAIH